MTWSPGLACGRIAGTGRLTGTVLAARWRLPAVIALTGRPGRPWRPRLAVYPGVPRRPGISRRSGVPGHAVLPLRFGRPGGRGAVRIARIWPVTGIGLALVGLERGRAIGSRLAVTLTVTCALRLSGTEARCANPVVSGPRARSPVRAD